MSSLNFPKTPWEFFILRIMVSFYLIRVFLILGVSFCRSLYFSKSHSLHTVETREAWNPCNAVSFETQQEKAGLSWRLAWCILHGVGPEGLHGSHDVRDGETEAQRS